MRHHRRKQTNASILKAIHRRSARSRHALLRGSDGRRRLLACVVTAALASLAGACDWGKATTAPHLPEKSNEGSPDAASHETSAAASGDRTESGESVEPSADGSEGQGAPESSTTAVPLGTDRPDQVEKQQAEPEAENAKAKTRPEQPWAHNTGPTNRDVLEPMSGTNIKVDGTVLENFAMDGELRISADNVTVRNCHIKCGSALEGSFYCVRVHDGVKNFVIEDCELEGAQSALVFSTSSITARRLHVHDSGADGFKIEGAGPSLIEQSFVEKIGVKPDAHADGVQTRGGRNITFRYNNIWLPHPGTPNYPGSPYKSNAAFILQRGTTNFTIDRNWLNGGSYTIYCDQSGTAFVTNNRFGRENAKWQKRKARDGLRSGNCTSWKGNVWDDNGRPL